MTNNPPPPASSGAPSGSAPPARPAKSRWYAASSWAGISGVATLLATVIALIAWLVPRSADTPPSAAGSNFPAPSSATPSSSAPSNEPLSVTSATPSSAAPSNGPLSVTLIQPRGCRAKRFYLPQDIDDIKPAIPPPPKNFDTTTIVDNYISTLDAWVKSVGGWQPTSAIEFSVEGNSARATILTDIRINLVSRTSLTSKTVLSIGDCGAPATPRHFSVSFDTTPPQVQALPGKHLDANGNLVPEEAVSFPFTVSETDPEIFDLVVKAGSACDCQWTATLSYTQAGQSYTTVIDDGGKPFHSLPGGGRVPNYYWPIDGSWVRL